jgi:hypothetical protein
MNFEQVSFSLAMIVDSVNYVVIITHPRYIDCLNYVVIIKTIF